MFDNIGEKIKVVAVVFTVLGFIATGLATIFLWSNGLFFAGLLILIVCGLASWLGSFLLYGFGELITKTTEIAERIQAKEMGSIFKSYGHSQTNAGNSALPSSAQNMELWTCRKCGAKNPSSKLYCKDCGEYR